MKILHCVPSMTGGGAERQLTYLVRDLRLGGCEVHVVLVHGGPNLERLTATGATIHQLHARGNHDPRIFVQLLRTIKAIQPDIVHCWLLQMEILGGLAALITGTPWVFSERSSELAYPPTVKHRLRVAVARRASAIVSNSEAGERYWQTRTNRRVKRYVIPNGLPIAEIDAARPATAEEIGASTDVPVVLSAGRIDAGKNFESLVRSLALLDADRRVHAICCGDGPRRDAIAQLIAERRLAGRVRLAGYVPNLWSLMKRANLVVSTSVFEGRPNVLLEAMACGCPLVVSDIPTHRELLDETTALLVDPRSPARVADAVRGVLDNPAAARDRARAARARVERYSTETVARQYVAVYRDLLQP